MNAMALFSLYLYFIFTCFVVIFYIFPELANQNKYKYKIIIYFHLQNK